MYKCPACNNMLVTNTIRTNQPAKEAGYLSCDYCFTSFPYIDGLIFFDQPSYDPNLSNSHEEIYDIVEHAHWI